MTLEEAESRLRTAGITGLVIAAITVTVVIAARLTQSEFLTVHGDPWNLIDVVLLTAASVGTLRRSRLAACALFGYYCLAQLANVVITGSAAALPIAVVVLIIFGRGAQAAFAYRRHVPSEAGPLKKGLIVLTLGFGSLLLLALGLGLLLELRVFPDTTVVSGSELRGSTVRMLREHGVIEPEETIRYFYSGGMFSYEEDGNVLTDRRVISYADLGEEDHFVASAAFDEIEGIDVSYSDDWYTDTVVEITPVAGQGFRLFVSIENELDHVFCDALIEAWQESRSDEAES